jgi:hypothetical protein
MSTGNDQDRRSRVLMFLRKVHDQRFVVRLAGTLSGRGPDDGHLLTRIRRGTAGKVGHSAIGGTNPLPNSSIASAFPHGLQIGKHESPIAWDLSGQRGNWPPHRGQSPLFTIASMASTHSLTSGTIKSPYPLRAVLTHCRCTRSPSHTDEVFGERTCRSPTQFPPQSDYHARSLGLAPATMRLQSIGIQGGGRTASAQHCGIETTCPHPRPRRLARGKTIWSNRMLSCA